ncbi:MAG: polyphosphate polymerase domain-containing protein [Clostridia bacterium]|nr:polyphosphate polymerase domain-containing protein [Clostridia bacterium]
MIQTVFNRVEKKYLLTKLQAERLTKKINEYIKPGEYPYTRICNIYFDTNNNELIRKSIEKPVYKEKVRLRSYGVTNKEDRVFLEIKKKFEGIVTKRRISLKLKDVYNYLENGKRPNTNKQIFNELDYCFKKYNLEPSMYISYERYSYAGKENENFRITFDTNIVSRDYDLKLDKGDYGLKLIGDDLYLMEIKAIDSMPIWFTKAISELKIYPISFSKYGKTYQNKLLKIS